jgi:hypothetical protein
MIERLLRRPCMGVIPHLPAIGLDEEDSVALEDRRTPARAWRGADAADASDAERGERCSLISGMYWGKSNDSMGTGCDARRRIQRVGPWRVDAALLPLTRVHRSVRRTPSCVSNHRLRARPPP